MLAVGAGDPKGTLTSADDVVASFAQHGTSAGPWTSSPRARVCSACGCPGSFVDTLAGNTGTVGDRFQRGSGTSEATAVVSGIAALLAQKFPTANPDAIKTPSSRPTRPPLAQGAATTEQPRHLPLQREGRGRTPTRPLNVTSIAASQSYPNATGTGTLDGARGGVYVTSNGIALTGQKDIFGKAFNSASHGHPASQRLLLDRGHLERLPLERRRLVRQPLVQHHLDRQRLGRLPLVRQPAGPAWPGTAPAGAEPAGTAPAGPAAGWTGSRWSNAGWN